MEEGYTLAAPCGQLVCLQYSVPTNTSALQTTQNSDPDPTLLCLDIFYFSASYLVITKPEHMNISISLTNGS